jgi:carbon-monoxide dehydrogenase large subunit
MATTQRTWIGKDVPRLEDPRLLMGRATYTDDVRLEGMAHAAVLRSPQAHAQTSVDTSRPARCPASSR